MIGRVSFFVLLLALTTGVSSQSVERVEDLDVKYGEYEYFDLNLYSKGGAIDAEVTVHEYRMGEGGWEPSARIGLVSEDHIHKIEIYLVKTKTAKGVVLGYRYFKEPNVVIERKVLFHDVPVSEAVKIQLKWDGAGNVTVTALNVTNSINTKIEWASAYLWASGTKARFRVEHSELSPNKAPKADGSAAAWLSR